jgi:hypothetical protein
MKMNMADGADEARQAAEGADATAIDMLQQYLKPPGHYAGAQNKRGSSVTFAGARVAAAAAAAAANANDAPADAFVVATDATSSDGTTNAANASNAGGVAVGAASAAAAATEESPVQRFAVQKPVLPTHIAELAMFAGKFTLLCRKSQQRSKAGTGAGGEAEGEDDGGGSVSGSGSGSRARSSARRRSDAAELDAEEGKIVAELERRGASREGPGLRVLLDLGGGGDRVQLEFESWGYDSGQFTQPELCYQFGFVSFVRGGARRRVAECWWRLG